MPKVFLPARATAAARGLRVLQGEPRAAARARALRATAGKRAQPALTAIDSATGAETTFRGVAPSLEASTATALAKGERAMKAEALRRHAKAREPDALNRMLSRYEREDASARRAGRAADPGPETSNPAYTEIARALRQLQAERRAFVQSQGRNKLAQKFKERYGYEPTDDALDSLSEAALEDLFFPE